LGLALAGYEIIRRINRITLLLVGDTIAIYRMGRLKYVAPRYALAPYVANLFVLLMRPMQMVVVIAGFFTSGLCLFVLMGVLNLGMGGNIGFLVVGGVVMASVASVLRTKFFRCRVLIMKNGRRKKIFINSRDFGKTVTALP